MEEQAKLSLLVVEDEALIAENLRLTLEDLGYAVAGTCYTFEEAQVAIATIPTDLVLLDINLSHADPTRNGLALAAGLQALGRPFIFLTAYNDRDTIRQATRLQPAGYLIKPANEAAIFAAIQTAIEHHLNRQPAPEPTEAAPEAPAYFFLKVGASTHKLQWADVLVLEAGKNYVTIRTAQPRLAYPVRGSLTAVLHNLVPPALRERFVRVNRRECVNLRHMTGFDAEWVYCGPEKFELTDGAADLLPPALATR